jgi:hypothetical protein
LGAAVVAVGADDLVRLGDEQFLAEALRTLEEIRDNREDF